jgi:dienelactone hydrolase
MGRLTDSSAVSYQARCITFARLGAVAFMWDMVDFNDSARQLTGEYTSPTYWNLHNRSWEHGRDRRALWNVNSFGVQLWNSIRALDFLSSLPEVDPERLACTGESGGATQTYMLYAVDDRVKAAAPVCMVSAHMQGGCACENAPGLRTDTNNLEIAAMMAPRPLMLVGATGDWTNNTPKVEYPAIKSIYELYGDSLRVQYAYFESSHGYTREMREAVYPFLARELGLSIDEHFKEPPYEPEKTKDLLSFDDSIPRHALRNHESLTDQLVASATEQVNALRPNTSSRLRGNWESLGIGLQISTGTATFQIDKLEHRLQSSCQVNGVVCQDSVFVGNRRGVQIPVRVYRPERSTPGKIAVLIDGRRQAPAEEPRARLLRGLLAAGQTVYVPDIFGSGRAARVINRRAQFNTNRGGQFFLTFNRSDDAERVYDIVAIVRHFIEIRATTLNVVGFNDGGPMLTIAAAMIEPSLKSSARFVIDGFLFNTSSEWQYLNDLFIPGILKAGGLPNALALIAPCPLFLHNTHTYVDTSCAKGAYISIGAASNFQVTKERRDDDELLDFLTEVQ